MSSWMIAVNLIKGKGSFGLCAEFFGTFLRWRHVGSVLLLFGWRMDIDDGNIGIKMVLLDLLINGCWRENVVDF